MTRLDVLEGGRRRRSYVAELLALVLVGAASWAILLGLIFALWLLLEWLAS